ncbi:MAG TPA: DUF1214 domain-containing protein [Rhizomicrobium sp.]|nr:DUF1214 domain-containing protein [Rhizomicrobium sp.]
MSTTSKVLLAIAAGIVLGLAVTWLTIVRGAGMGGDVTDGPWRTSLLTGSTESGMAHRATIALHGLFALNRHETIYYTAITDSDGNRLDGADCYTIAGRDPPTRWWSITAYGSDDFLIPNANGHYSVSKNSIRRDGNGAFRASVSTRPADDITVAPGAFSLTLRLYNPDPAVAADPAHVALPAIHREACR